MEIGLIDVDGHHYPNLALMKLSAWHKRRGDNVEWYFGFTHYDRVYMSRVFDDTYSKDYEFPINADEVVKGGTGYGMTNNLPDEVEHIMPDYSLYGITDTAYGFLTRGCPRHCDFCIVGDKEGLTSRKVADLSEFWDGQPNIELLDPNLLACRDRLELLDQLIDSKAYVNFSQGLDIRLTNSDVIDRLNRMKIKRIHFAWDNPNDKLEPYFKAFAEAYRRKSRKGVYVLTNFGSTLEQDLYRVNTLASLGYDPYVMIYDKPHAPKDIKRLQRWCNSKWIFRSCAFENYMR